MVQQNLLEKSGSIIPVMLYRFIAMVALYRLIAMFRMTVHESKHLISICYVMLDRTLFNNIIPLPITVSYCTYKGSVGITSTCPSSH